MDAKLLLLMYLEDDQACVDRVLADQGVTTYSRLSMEGVVPGASSGWYGVTSPYQSRLILAHVPAERAGAVMAAVSECRGVEDPRHPIRALQLAVERSASCECPTAEDDGSGTPLNGEEGQ